MLFSQLRCHLHPVCLPIWSQTMDEVVRSGPCMVQLPTKGFDRLIPKGMSVSPNRTFITSMEPPTHSSPFRSPRVGRYVWGTRWNYLMSAGTVCPLAKTALTPCTSCSEEPQ